jgi:hypothetical protein
MAKDAAVASTTIFIMTIPLVSGQHRLPEAPEIEQPKRDAPLFPSPLSQSGFHRCTLNDALTALTTQPKSARITCTVDPFRESVARIARTQAAEAVRIAVLETAVTESGLVVVSAALSVAFLRGVRSSPRFEFSSKFLESAAQQSGTPCDRYPATEGPVGIPDVAVFGRLLWVAGAEDAALSGAGGDSDMRLQGSLVTP